MKNLSEMGVSIKEFTKKHTGVVILASTLSTGAVAAGGYEAVVREGQDVQPIVKAATKVFGDIYAVCEEIPGGRKSIDCIKVVNIIFNGKGF